MKYANSPERLSLLHSLSPNGQAFLISFWQNFSMRRRLNKNICQRSIIIAWRLWWSFLCSRVFFCVIPFRFRTPQNCVLLTERKEKLSLHREWRTAHWISPCDRSNWTHFCFSTTPQMYDLMTTGQQRIGSRGGTGKCF